MALYPRKQAPRSLLENTCNPNRGCARGDANVRETAPLRWQAVQARYKVSV
jgi:hypothetical protein